ncbi:lysophospholipid acyltransferase family protein [Hymenobacter sp. J193]|uniref:lysophospholipid acyltransferase family protein n=1 Tax=Hymenobacter sp. J193 TaxID=2898429 RepID=UPI00215101C5|nr:lysophospholipid acyltransferase family protein [Hymenobacter sp. J193]MCR5886968.1 lysophospholipid acyltransferase family protein [Hymenobacter sp. J193]
MSSPVAAATYPWYFRPLDWLLRATAALPLPLLYGLAEVLYFLMAYVLRYRQRVVLENLRNSFPEKTEAEHRQLARRFYRHFAQLMVEILWLRQATPAQLNRRVEYPNKHVITDRLKEGKSLLALGSHAGNWEWILTSGQLQLDVPAVGVYQPLNNAFFDEFMYKLRTRTGAELVTMRETIRYMAATRNRQKVLSMLSDQSPSNPTNRYWTELLHQDTAFYTGADRLAAHFQMPVVYVSIQRVRRGYYRIVLEELFDGQSPLNPDQHQITEAFARALERDIQRAPADYLWSHRRWKHKR